jgi:hypothetical protein
MVKGFVAQPLPPEGTQVVVPIIDLCNRDSGSIIGG